MIFIYPASVSETCDRRIIPAVCKSIERFFLLQIQDAVTSGVLTFSRKWDGHRYGPLMMESVIDYNKKQKTLMEDYSTYIHYSNELRKCKDLDDVDNVMDSVAGSNSLDDNELRELDKFADRKYNEIQTQDRRQSDEEYRRGRDNIEDKYRMNKDEQDDYYRRRKDAREERKDAREQTRQKQYDEKHMLDMDKGSAEVIDKYHTPIGNYIPMDSKIDIVPTGGTVETSILLKGGKNHNRLQNYCMVNINVKVMPTIIKNFKILERDLLNDYFSRKSESYFKSAGRNIARKAYNALKNLPFNIGDVIWQTGMEIAGEEIDTEAKKDIIYNTHGFVNASAFHKSSSAPGNYNFTSNIVIFNKDDLTNPEDQNIFLNRSAMQKLFKLGWSTFCMLDPVEEMMYFISSLDGGYLHPVPYRYLMESYGSRAYYGTEEKLKDSARPFLIKRGNFSTFGKLFNKKR